MDPNCVDTALAADILGENEPARLIQRSYQFVTYFIYFVDGFRANALVLFLVLSSYLVYF